MLVHYAMIRYRLGGEKQGIDPETESTVDNDRAAVLLRWAYRNPELSKRPFE